MILDHSSSVGSQPVVGFIIGTFGHGRGGHYWDLKTIAENFNEKANVIIFNVGISSSPVLTNSTIKVINLPLKFMRSIKIITEEIRERNIQSLFCIDIRVAIIAEVVSHKTQTPIVHIKPGGPNPSSDYPNFHELIVYSKENYNYFKSLKNYNKTTLHFLPNRSEKVSIDEMLVKELDTLDTNNAFKFVQVLRICKAYENNIHSALELIRRIKLAGRDSVALFVIGVVQDKVVFERLLSSANGLPVHFITDSKYTESASKLLSIGDAVIGNGRSVMEASSLGLPVLVSACNSDIPILLEADSFKKAFEVNFSPRFELSEKEIKLDKSFSNIIRLVNESSYREQIAKLSLQSFDTYFDIRKVVDKYLEISQQSTYHNRSLFSFFKLFRLYIVSCVRAYREN